MTWFETHACVIALLPAGDAVELFVQIACKSRTTLHKQQPAPVLCALITRQFFAVAKSIHSAREIYGLN